MRTVDDLQYNGLKIIQDRDGFRFGMDAVLLANLAPVNGVKKALDLGCGNGIVPILLAGKRGVEEVFGIDINEKEVEMAKESVKINGLSGVKIIAGDLRNIQDYFEYESFDLVTANPPYLRVQTGDMSPNPMRAAARHEIYCTLKDVLNAAFKVLRSGGSLFMVHRTERLAEVLGECRNSRLEPKSLYMVYPRINDRPNLFLVRCVKCGSPDMIVERPIIIYNSEGNYTEEYLRIYYGGEGD
ncbi:tRNA1(Val) (adenine(37)-N6)-methyltransferase [Calorimonas adulescens]|jgi:Methyltransferase small domain.|uniref:tRNA1(Val) (Adenine(37)-N6)-methyltransferase n=1 Tax=Calorimonas adulescens TaxID=2606906 RepID=A0A5D8QBM7_9THEO|nr:tRNA1(Val) (adenine(37)-N6)-methyltransferase [Calorimonas adulescens]TZE82135.1 tRNA1(Val) (adenine(37)-N6)-methyltransferase [Calorimonas adulescens]